MIIAPNETVRLQFDPTQITCRKEDIQWTDNRKNSRFSCKYRR